MRKGHDWHTHFHYATVRHVDNAVPDRYMSEALTLQSACTKHPKAVDVAVWRHYKKEIDQCRRLSSREYQEPVCTLQQPATEVQHVRYNLQTTYPHYASKKHVRMCMNWYKQSPGPDSGWERWSTSTSQSMRIPRMLGLMSCCMTSIKFVVGLLLICGMQKGRAIQVSSTGTHPVLSQGDDGFIDAHKCWDHVVGMCSDVRNLTSAIRKCTYISVAYMLHICGSEWSLSISWKFRLLDHPNLSEGLSLKRPPGWHHTAPWFRLMPWKPGNCTCPIENLLPCLRRHQPSSVTPVAGR